MKYCSILAAVLRLAKCEKLIRHHPLINNWLREFIAGVSDAMDLEKIIDDLVYRKKTLDLNRSGP